MPNKNPVITVTTQPEDGASTGRGDNPVAPASPRKPERRKSRPLGSRPGHRAFLESLA